MPGGTRSPSGRGSRSRPRRARPTSGSSGEEGELGDAEELERRDVEQPDAEAQLELVGEDRPWVSTWTAVENSSRSSHRTRPEKYTARSAHAQARITAGSTTRRRSADRLISGPRPRHGAPRSSPPFRQAEAREVAALEAAPRAPGCRTSWSLPSASGEGGQTRGVGDQHRFLVEDGDFGREACRRGSGAVEVHTAG